MAVLAKNQNGTTRMFKDKTWEMLPTGKDGTKNGWTAVSASEVKFTRQSAAQQKPSTGGDAKIKGPVYEQKIQNENKQPAAEQSQEPTEKRTGGSPEEFLKAAEGIQPGVVKDYFDKNSIVYGKKATPEQLYGMLGQQLNWDTIELQKLFS